MRLGTALPQFRCNDRHEMIHPASDCLVRNCNSALREQVLDIAKAEGKSEIEPDRLVNDLWREPISGVADFGWVILGQFIPVEGQNRLASPRNDRINSSVLFLEIARLPRHRIRANRAQEVRVLTLLQTQRSIRDMQHSDVGSERLQRLFEIRPLLAKDRLRQPDCRRVNRHFLHLSASPLLHDFGRADPIAHEPCRRASCGR